MAVMNIKRIFTWLSFITLIGLVIWGLIAAEQKSKRENEGILLPDQITSTDHIWGREDALVTIVEYSDFQCPACRSYSNLINKFMDEESSTTARFVYRHFPLEQHPNAMPAAKSAEAAGKQDKFFEMYKILFERQPDWENSKDAKSIFITYAEELGLDKEKFSSDYELPEIADRINNDYKSGVKAKVGATPTFFINGKQITNPQSYEEFKKIIGDALPESII